MMESPRCLPPNYERLPERLQCFEGSEVKSIFRNSFPSL